MYRTEKLLKDNADKISGDDKAKLEAAVSAVKEALKGSDAAAIKSANEKLDEVCPGRRRGTLQGRGGEGAG